MDLMSNVMVIGLAVLLVVVVGGIFLQIYLSKRKSKWPGLVLPGIELAYSLFVAFGLITYGGAASALAALVPFLLCNIPTAVLLAIYFACREKLNKRSDVEKMNIQDL